MKCNIKCCSQVTVNQFLPTFTYFLHVIAQKTTVVEGLCIGMNLDHSETGAALLGAELCVRKTADISKVEKTPQPDNPSYPTQNAWSHSQWDFSEQRQKQQLLNKQLIVLSKHSTQPFFFFLHCSSVSRFREFYFKKWHQQLNYSSCYYCYVFKSADHITHMVNVIFCRLVLISGEVAVWNPWLFQISGKFSWNFGLKEEVGPPVTSNWSSLPSLHSQLCWLSRAWELLITRLTVHLAWAWQPAHWATPSNTQHTACSTLIMESC